MVEKTKREMSETESKMLERKIKCDRYAAEQGCIIKNYELYHKKRKAKTAFGLLILGTLIYLYVMCVVFMVQLDELRMRHHDVKCTHNYLVDLWNEQGVPLLVEKYADVSGVTAQDFMISKYDVACKPLQYSATAMPGG